MCSQLSFDKLGWGGLAIADQLLAGAFLCLGRAGFLVVERDFVFVRLRFCVCLFVVIVAVVWFFQVKPSSEIVRVLQVKPDRLHHKKLNTANTISVWLPVV
jgi:hypothetical protein